MPINDTTEYKATDRHVFLVSVFSFIYCYNYYYYYYFVLYFFIDQNFRLVFTHPCCYDNDRNATFNLTSFMPAASLT